MMRDITNKTSTLRTARTQAVVFCLSSTLQAVRDRKIPKGDVLEFARAAGYLGAKNTPHLIPHCHPITIDSLKFDFEFLTEDNYRTLTSLSVYRPGIVIQCEAKCIGRTGIEVDAMTGVTVAALTMYDILKPLDDHIEISEIKVLQKTGGKSERKYFTTPPTCAILVCSDSTFHKKREDVSGKLIRTILDGYGAKIVDDTIVPDEKSLIQQKIKEWGSRNIDFIFTTGGTGLGPRDNTVEAVNEILERNAEGISEAMRAHGQMRTPLAMMSRAVAGSIGSTMIVTLPGSSAGVQESLDAILPAVFHARSMLKGDGH